MGPYGFDTDGIYWMSKVGAVVVTATVIAGVVGSVYVFYRGVWCIFLE